MSENTTINNINFTGISVKQRIYQWNMFGNVDSCSIPEIVDTTSSSRQEQSFCDFENGASLSEVNEEVYEKEEVEGATINEVDELASSMDEEFVYRYKPGLFVTPFKGEYSPEPFDRKKSREAKFIEIHTPNIKHKRHSSIRARYLIDQEIIGEIKKGHKYSESDREAIIKINILGQDKENIKKELNVENIPLQSIMEQSTHQPESNQEEFKEEVSTTHTHEQSRIKETRKKKKGFFRRIFGCFVL